MEAKFSNRVKEVISLSREEALRLGHDYIGTEHLLLGVIREGEGVAIGLLKKLGISLEDLRASVEHNTKNTTSSNLKNVTNIPLTRQTEKVLKITYLEAKIFKSKLIGTEHLLLSILRDDDNIATQILDKFDVTYDVVKELLEYQTSNPQASTSSEPMEEDDMSSLKGSSSSKTPKTKEKSKTPILDNFGKDLTKLDKINLNQKEAIVLASIVASESRMLDEADRIAGLYINRLNRNMRLQADPTLIFAANDFTIRRVLNKHKKIKSPYNTYIHRGLPPGPIRLASKKYIDAVLNYEKHNYIYMCAKEDFSGYHAFATNLSDHNRNAKKFQIALNMRKIYR